MVDEVEVSVIEESQPPGWPSSRPRWTRWSPARVRCRPSSPPSRAERQDRANLGKRGVKLVRLGAVRHDHAVLQHGRPVVGGYTPEKVALRRAVSLAYDVQREITLIRRGLGIPAQSPMVPFTSGYDPAFKSEMSEFDRPRRGLCSTCTATSTATATAGAKLPTASR
jgi:hypothetical protein